MIRAGSLALRVALIVLGAGPAVTAPVRVSVAISLEPAITAAIEDYAAAHPHAGFEVNGGASGVLLQQLRAGAAADVFISASPREVDRLIDAGLADARSRRKIGSNRLVVVVPRSADAPSSFADLAAMAGGGIAVANPRTAPLGRYTLEALVSAGLWDALEPHAVYAESARRTLDYAARGEVAAAVVYASDAERFSDRVRLGPAVPDEYAPTIAYEAVLLSETRLAEQAGAWLAWLGSAEGRASLARHGIPAP